MHLFRGLQGNRVNFFEKSQPLKIQRQQSTVQPEPTQERELSQQDKSRSSVRLRSYNGRVVHRKEKQNLSLNKIERPHFEKRLTGLYHVKEEQEIELPPKSREPPKDSRRPTKKESVKIGIGKPTANREPVNIIWPRIQAFFRYYPIWVISLCGEREEYMKQLSEGSIKTFGSNPPKRSQPQNCEKLLKSARLKGKYKYRQRYNPSLSEQLKSMNYKLTRRDATKKKKDDSSSEEDDDDRSDKKQKFRDLAGWKKNMGVNGKVFIVKGGYRDLRNALLERGWVENPDKYSKLFDFKWTTKINDLQFDNLENKQIVNHFDNNQCLTSKYGLCKSVRTVIYNEGVDVDRFFPRCYDIADLGDFENFLQNYKWTFCESILKNYLISEKEFEKTEYKVKISLMVTERRLTDLNVVVDHMTAKAFGLCSPEEWALLTDVQSNQDLINRVIKKFEMKEMDLSTRVRDILKNLEQKDPQYNLSGSRNIWILKPSYLSRGRGIRCAVKLPEILDQVLGKDIQYVVQKYIENPLVIMNRKFDIRQWVLVEDYNPPKVWFYEESYLRFCAEEYNMDNVGNKFMHLTNNSIQKYSKEFNKSEIQGNMLTHAQFAAFIGQKEWQDIQRKMKQIVILTIKATEDQVAPRKNTFELFGYDFMIDADLNPWLIEVNSSPAMDYSTPVTKRLVKMVMEDTIKVMVDSTKKKAKSGTGLFKCIYKGEQVKTSYGIP